MAFDENLAEKIRTIVSTHSSVTEKKMFGGLAFLVNGNMSITVSGKGGVLARVGADLYEKLRDESGVELAIMRGKPMNGWLRVSPGNLGTKKQLERWVRYCLAYAEELPPKK